MNKYLSIVAVIAISSFLATNFYLLFSDKSVISKSVYVGNYERMTMNDYSDKLAKEALVSPLDLYTVYINQEDTVEAWFVTEGDAVSAGEELALLNTERTDNQRNLWEVERDALLQEETELQSQIRDLSAARSQAETGNTSNVGQKQGITEVEEKTTIELDLNIDFKVDVTQEGAYAQAIATAEQQLVNVRRQLDVVQAQLDQNPNLPTLISPVDGVVSKIEREGSILSIDLYSEEKIITTYVKENEWEKVEENDRVQIQGDKIEGILEGTIYSVSKVPAEESKTLEAYKALDSKYPTNPLAYYEVKMSVEGNLDEIPYGQNLNAIVLTDEAQNAVATKESWLHFKEDDNATLWKLNPSGYAIKSEVVTPFTWNKRAVITEGLYYDEIVLEAPLLKEYSYAPGIFFPMPSYKPTAEEWKTFGKRNYVKYMLLR